MDKKIGVLVSRRDDSFGISLAYFMYLSSFGTVVFINTQDPNINTEIDLLVLPGGPDVDSNRYGKFPHPTTRTYSAHFEYFDINVLPKYVDNGTPIFGICRGFQSLNVFFGGSLTQHMNVPVSRKSRGETVEELIFLHKDYQKVELSNSYFVPDNKKKIRTYSINSLHHQGITGKLVQNKLRTGWNIVFEELAEDLIPLGYVKSENTYNLECFTHRTLPIVGVQWHPEEIDCYYSRLQINRLLNL